MHKDSPLVHGFNAQKILYWMTKPTQKIFEEAGNFHSEETRFIYHKVEGATILAVGHLDTVQELSDLRRNAEGDELYGSCFDDRIGIYVIMEWLKANKIKASVLLTDLEERGRSTAEHFIGADKYNWVVEFDRAGEDVVTYGLDSDEWISALEGCGFRVAHGSFSDICALPTKRCCVNISVGYEMAHSKESMCNLEVLHRQLNKFCIFYDMYKDIAFDQAPRSVPSGSGMDYNAWYGDGAWAGTLRSRIDESTGWGFEKSSSSLKSTQRCSVCSAYSNEWELVGSDAVCIDCIDMYNVVSNDSEVDAYVADGSVEMCECCEMSVPASSLVFFGESRVCPDCMEYLTCDLEGN